MTRQDWIHFCGSLTDAILIENQILSCGLDFLPECAIQVLNGTVVEPKSDYWSWLIEQLVEE